MGCWITIRMDDQYAAEALELSAEEVAQSNDLRQTDKVVLDRLLAEIRRTGEYRDTPSVNKIRFIFKEYEGFQAQTVRVVAERMHGKRWDSS